eukprot:TRINITY_DN1629_c0_g1_i1.p1 TRINITY_DN1629_c0_g1~~TRINITY_DN1629_c0_g1_i1.p1  ORF type:complete len:988 (+),score=293.25 TRINITY_DN1629_c0_g1_i1:3-2966(+)
MIPWRRFQFFDKEPVSSAASSPNDIDISKLAQTCCTSGRGYIIVGDGYGYVHLIDRESKVSSFMCSTNGVTQLLLCRDRNVLVAVGTDDDAMAQAVKLWNMDRLDSNGIPFLIKEFKIPQKMNGGAPATTLSATNDISKIAIGFCNGAIVLVSGGDLTRERNPVIKLIKAESKEPITTLSFEQKGELSLFVTTTTTVSVFSFSQFKEVEKSLDSEGAELGAAAIRETGELAVGRANGVFCYTNEERSSSFGLEGKKKLLAFFHSYLIVVCEEKSYGPAGSSMVNYDSFSIYDLKNQFIAFNDTKMSGVTHVISEWGSIHVLCHDGKTCTLWRLEEKDNQTKLDTLFKKGLYSVAVDFARSQQFDKAIIVDILTKYGDHLYGKGDFNAAIEQYVKTIGHLEPSYVIRKFLDAQRIHNLTTYLQKLHENGKATADHTTLLLNCYTKLKDVKNLEKFLKSDSKEVNFDVETAIKVCRQAGYHPIALYLAKKFQQHDWFLKIMLEDLGKHDDALDYIEQLPFTLAEANIKKYGKLLINAIPEKTSKFLMRLCTEMFETEEDAADGSPIMKQAAPEEFIHIFVSQPMWLTTFLEFVHNRCRNESPLVADTLLECYLRDPSEYSETVETPADKTVRLNKAFALLTDPNAKYDPDQALVQSQAHDFKEGVLFLMDKLKLYHVLIQYHMENKSHDAIIEQCKKSGAKDPNLWIQVLSYFASCDEDCQSKIAEVLKNIDSTNLLPPLLVTQILAQKPSSTLGIVKDFLVKRLEQEKTLCEEDERAIRNSREDTEKMKREIQDLTTGARIFQLNKCSLCHQQLDLPAVHFLCLHSFHQRCLGENEECPECTPVNRQTLDRARAQEADAVKHEQFMRHLESSNDGFSVIAEYFGRGIFNVLSHSEFPSAAPVVLSPQQQMLSEHQQRQQQQQQQQPAPRVADGLGGYSIGMTNMNTNMNINMNMNMGQGQGPMLGGQRANTMLGSQRQQAYPPGMRPL